MAKFNYTTVTRKILADLYTPVGVYMRLRDIYPQSALMESSDDPLGSGQLPVLHRRSSAGKHRRESWRGHQDLS